jgi:hypothetical protein
MSGEHGCCGRKSLSLEIPIPIFHASEVRFKEGKMLRPMGRIEASDRKITNIRPPDLGYRARGV